MKQPKRVIYLRDYVPPGLRRLGPFFYDNVMNPAGFAWLFIYGIGPWAYVQFSSWDPLLWRTFAAQSEHHILNLDLIALSFILSVLYFAKQSGQPILKWGFFAALASWVMLATHEGEWWLTLIIYNLVHGFYLNWQWFAQGGEIIALATFVLLPIVTNYFPWRFCLWMLAFQVVWFVAGFPITVYYTGNTVFFNDPYVSLWEISSWAWAVGGFYITERKAFYLMAIRVKGNFTNRQNYLTKTSDV